MRRILVILPLLLLLPAGCTTSRPQPPVIDSGIEPLHEADFDRIANELADRIVSLTRENDYRPPAQITVPRAESDGVEPRDVTRAFARRLAEGLNDRMRGVAVFMPPGVTVPDLYCSLHFLASPDDPGERAVIFRLIDRESRKELLTRKFDYQPFRPRPVARDAPPRKRGLEIDAPAAEIGRLALQHAPDHSARTVAGEAGRVVFLDHKAWRRLRLQSQRATRLANRLLRVELDIRARRKARDVHVRLVFYDREGNPVSATHVIPCHFRPEENPRFAIVSASPRAQRYVCLITDD